MAHAHQSGAPRLHTASLVATRNAGSKSWRKPSTSARTQAGPVSVRFVTPTGPRATIDGSVMRDSFEWYRPYRRGGSV